MTTHSTTPDDARPVERMPMSTEKSLEESAMDPLHRRILDDPELYAAYNYGRAETAREVRSFENEIARLARENRELREALERMYRPNHNRNCAVRSNNPRSDGTTPATINPCDCGRDAHNANIDAALSRALGASQT